MGGNIPPGLGRKVFSPTSSKDEARDFRQELGGFCFVPLLPKAVMTPPHTRATPPQRTRLWSASSSPGGRRQQIRQMGGRETPGNVS